MRRSRSAAVRYRRATGLYLAAIAAPTLVLLWLGLQSIQRHADAYDMLRHANLRMSVERAGQDLHHVIASHAARALRDPVLGTVTPLLEAPPTPATQRQVRTAFSRLAAQHPVVSQYFVQHGRHTVFPRAVSPLPLTLDNLLKDMSVAGRARATAAFARAERLEVAQAFTGALAVYQQCARLPGPRAVRALALLRASRVARGLGQESTSRELLRELRTRYGDEYDLFHRPYALVSTVELAALDQQTMADMLGQLHAGRWEVSGDQATYFLARLGGSSSPASSSRLLRELALLRVLENEVSLRDDVKDSEFVPFEGVGEHPVAGWYRVLGGTLQPSIVGFSLEAAWVRTRALPQVMSRMRVPGTLELVTSTAQSSDDMIRLAPPLSSYGLRLRPASNVRSEFSSDRLLLAGGTLGVLGVLLLGVVLLVRDVARETQIARMRQEFVSGVSHQLRTPLTLIRLYGEMLADNEDLAPAERRAHVGVITDESRRLTGLVERVLDFAQVEQGRKAYVLQHANLADALRPVLDAYLPHLRRLGFAVSLHVEPSLPAVRIDEAAVADSVVNLLDNAVKYSGVDKHITIRLGVHRGSVTLDVEDRGAGVPERDRERIFEPFERGSGAYEKGGYGLGLYLVREVMHAHGGAVEMHSRAGAGSVFRLVFPA